jgi:Na+/proline symporter
MSIGSIALLVMLVTAGVFALLGLIHASSHASKSRLDLEEYMVSRNRFGSGMAFATIVASAMGVWILFSPPQVGASYGIAGLLGYCVGSAAPVLAFARLGPRIRRLMPNGHSLNEFVLYRFGNVMYLLTLVIIVFYMFIYLAAELTAIAKATEIIAGVPLYVTALVVITATFIYTTYGGLGAAVFTDAIQFVVIVPLLLVSLIVAIAALNGWDAALQPVLAKAPQLFSLANVDGLKFGASLLIAILAAEIFNQSNWQRIYACRDNATVKRAFTGSAIAIFPMILLAGGLGFLAMNFGFNDDRAFFSLLQKLSLPLWFVMTVLVLALALVMSTLSSLLNGIASVFTIDLIRLFPQMQTAGLLRLARILTVAAGIPAIALAAQGYDVLYLFLLADLVCAGAVFPVIYGMYAAKMTGAIATASTLAGIVAGALFFPKPDFTAWLNIPFGGDLLVSFSAAVVVAAAVALVGTAMQRDAFDFAQLNQRVRMYTDADVNPTNWEEARK